MPGPCRSHHEYLALRRTWFSSSINITYDHKASSRALELIKIKAWLKFQNDCCLTACFMFVAARLWQPTVDIQRSESVIHLTFRMSPLRKRVHLQIPVTWSAMILLSTDHITSRIWRQPHSCTYVPHSRCLFIKCWTEILWNVRQNNKMQGGQGKGSTIRTNQVLPAWRFRLSQSPVWLTRTSPSPALVANYEGLCRVAEFSSISDFVIYYPLCC